MRRIFKLIILCLSFGLLAACTQEEVAGEQPELALSSSSSVATVDSDGLGADVVFAGTGGIAEIEVTSNCRWTVTPGTGSWCAVETDNSTLRIVAEANPESVGRIANFKVTAANATGSVEANIVVLQAVPGELDVPVEFTLQGEDTDVILPAEGGSYRVGVTSSEDWTAVADDSWISIEQDEEGFTVTVEENSTVGIRHGSVSVTAGESSVPYVLVVSQSTTSTSAMILEVTVGTETANTVILPIDDSPHEETSAIVNCLVDWGDGTLSRVFSGYPSHTYDEAGVYDVSITGTVTIMRANQSPELNYIRPTITAVKQWGNLGLVKMRYGFYYCANLRTIALPGEDSFKSLVSIYNCFQNCTSLESIPEAMFEGTPIEDPYSAFSGCSTLKEVPARLFAGCTAATRFSMIFKNCSSLTTIAPDAFEGCNPEEGFLQGFYGTAITSIPEGLFASCTSSENFSNAFANCASLTSIPENLFSGLTGITNLMNAFSNCTGLTEVPAELFSGLTAVTNLSGVFSGCTGLTGLPAGIFSDQASSVTNISNTFKGWTGLESVPEDIFSGLTEVTNLSGMFDGCTSLTEVPAGIFRDQASVMNISNIFRGCTSLESVPGDVFSGKTAVTNISGVFSGCSELASIPAGIFDGMTAVTNVSNLCLDCTSLTSVPEGIFAGMSKVTNCSAAFSGCTSLTSVPVSLFDDCVKVTNFGNTFNGCAALTGESPYTEIDGTRYHLYERADNDTFASVRTTAGCFAGCTGLSDYSTILSDYPDWIEE